MTTRRAFLKGIIAAAAGAALPLELTERVLAGPEKLPTIEAPRSITVLQGEFEGEPSPGWYPANWREHIQIEIAPPTNPYRLEFFDGSGRHVGGIDDGEMAIYHEYWGHWDSRHGLPGLGAWSATLTVQAQADICYPRAEEVHLYYHGQKVMEAQVGFRKYWLRSGDTLEITFDLRRA